MKGDPGVNYTIVEGLPMLSRGVDIYETAVVDHALAPSATFAISCMTWAADFKATLQYSDDGETWTDETSGAGNTVSQTLYKADFALIHVPNPRGRYSQLSVDVGATNVFGVINISGPLRSVAP